MLDLQLHFQHRSLTCPPRDATERCQERWIATFASSGLHAAPGSQADCAARRACQGEDGKDDLKKGTQLLEVYALEIQMHTELKNSKRLKELYSRALTIKSAIPHPRIMGIIRECGGKMHMHERVWSEAATDFFEVTLRTSHLTRPCTTSAPCRMGNKRICTPWPWVSNDPQLSAFLHASVAEIACAQCDTCRTFQDLHAGCARLLHAAAYQKIEDVLCMQAFKSYDEAGAGRRIQCLKYLVLATMLMESAVDPFDAQEAAPYKQDPEVLAMTNLVAAYQENNIKGFERILKTNKCAPQRKAMELVKCGRMSRVNRKHVAELLISCVSLIQRQYALYCSCLSWSWPLTSL